MGKKQWIAWLGILVVAGGLGAMTYVPRYLPGLPPIIGDIQSMCVEEYPAPRDRTDLGIGEEVRCWIDPSTWNDVDICIDADGNQKEVGDALGAVIWSAQGPATVYPIVTDGSAVTMTSDLGGDDNAATLIATVFDSGTMGENEPIEVKKQFNIYIPRGVGVIHAQDNPPAKEATPPAKRAGTGK